MRYKLLITEPDSFNPEAIHLLSSFCLVTAKSSTYNSLIEEIFDYDIVFIRLGIKFDEILLGKGKKLKFLVSPTTGLDHIDLQTAKNLGIRVLSLRGETEFLKKIHATSELTWGLILSLLRNIPWAFDDVKNGNWNRDAFRGTELNSKRLGILGLGRLGEHVARYGNAFGMLVHAYDPYRAEWPENVSKVSNLEDLLKISDVLSIHVPLNAETEGLIGKNQMKEMPKGSWIINTSRGKVIDEEALLENLESGHIAGAGLDVISDEIQGTGTMANSKLIQYSVNNRNLIICPHIGGATFDAFRSTELYMAEKLLKELSF